MPQLSTRFYFKRSMFRLFTAFAFSVASLASYAEATKTVENNIDSKETLVASNVRMPKLPPVSRSAAIYLTLDNHGDKAVELTGVTTPAAHHAMIHQTIEEDGLAKMRHQDRLLIPAQGKLVFQPGSYHIMLMGLDREVIKAPFEITLEFAHRAPIDLTVTPDQ